MSSEATVYSEAVMKQLPVLEHLARHSLPLWDCVPAGASVTLINVSENVTFRVDAPGFRSVLRVHRPEYHSLEAIRSELVWARALDRDDVIETPPIYTGTNGERVQTMQIDAWQESRQLVMFGFVDGSAPAEDDDLLPLFEQLGAIAAKTHNHVKQWRAPADFTRLSWDQDAVFGPQPVWGRWMDAPGLNRTISATLGRLQDTLLKRLELFGCAADRFGLIHADMRLANLLVDDNTTRLIDFDDCGFGWHLYDFAAAVSFIEDHPQLNQLRDCWIRGYRQHRTMSREEEDEIATFVMLRRMALLAWIGSHIDAPEPRAMAPDFAVTTATLARTYLARFS